MQSDFWHKKWTENKIGFHEGQPNSLLVTNAAKLGLKTNDRVFVPLCGKTVDIAWFLQQGIKVVGAELSKMAIDQLFTDLGMTPQVSSIDELLHYSHENIDIYVGDIFNLSAEIIGQVDAIYDRAALVALPPSMRIDYSKHMLDITNNAQQLLICFEYDQNLMSGPPFSIDENEVRTHYGQAYDIELLQSAQANRSFPGNQVAHEKVWLLKQG